jgi:heptaprenyl diphosphate synthase
MPEQIQKAWAKWQRFDAALTARLDQFRKARRGCVERLFASRDLFIAGLIIMPALLFNPVWIRRVDQFLLFWFFAWLCGKKNNPLITLLIIFFITAFNLLVPYGEVLYAIGSFKITAGALSSGITKAVTLEGLIMLSRATIRQDLRLPGYLGRLIGDSFRIFEKITEKKGAIDRKNIAGSLDKLLFELSEEEAGGQAGRSAEAADNAAPLSRETQNAEKRLSTPAGYCILVCAVLIFWLMNPLFENLVRSYLFPGLPYFSFSLTILQFILQFILKPY